MKRKMFLLMTATTVGVILATGSQLFASSHDVTQLLSNETANSFAPTSSTSEEKKEMDSIAAAIVASSDVSLKFVNDDTYPWIINGNEVRNGNCGVPNSTSVLTFSFNSKCRTKVSFDWRCYCEWPYNHRPLTVYVDGVEKATTSNSSFSNCWFFIEPGDHVVMFKDVIDDSSSDNYYSYIKNITVKELQPLETAVLTEKSQPLEFVNEGTWPWTIEDGYIQSSNYGNRNSVSKFSTSFTITKPSKFSFWSSNYWYDNNGNAYGYNRYQYFDFKINGERYMGREQGEGTTSLLLEPGTYTMEWCDSIYDNTDNCKARVKDVELSSNWVDVELSTAGSLGVEILYKVNVLNDVELLKVKGTLNSTDWETIKRCKNLIGIDLTEAKFDAVPDYAFDGMSWVSSVKLPDGVKTIGDYAFRGTQLLNIDIPSTVTSIGNYAFYQTRVRTVNFKDDSQLKTIGYQAFYECRSLKEFIMPNTVTKLRTYNDRADRDSETFRECTALKKMVFSDALINIPGYSCYNCHAIEELHLPSNVVSIGQFFLNAGNSLKKLNLPQSIQAIGRNAFDGLQSVDSIVIPESVQSIGYRAFCNSARISYVDLPSGLSLYDQWFYNCTNIKKIVCHSATPPAISSDPFSSITKANVTLEVPAFAVVSYKLNDYWYQFGNIVEGANTDYWKVFAELPLTNNRRMDGKPSIDLYYGGKLRVGGNAPMPTANFNYYVSEDNPGCLINDCPAMTADNLSTRFYVEANRWYFITPIHEVDLTKVMHSANASFVFRYYDGASRGANGAGNSWRNVDTGKLNPGQGYIFQCNASGTLTLPADEAGHARMFGTTDITTSLSAHESAAAANKNWNYVGNPYPAYYDVFYMDFTAPITVWTGNTYKAYSIVDDNFVLRPMQTFFVQKPDEIDQIVFHKEGRQFTSSIERPANAPAMAKSGSQRLLYDFQIANANDVTDETRVVLNGNAASTYEMLLDASKFMSINNSVPQIFTVDGDGNTYAINERPIGDGSVVLGYRAAQAGFYTVSVVRADGNVLLYDKHTNKTVDLTAQDYTFYSEATETFDTSRFVLKFDDSSATSIDGTHKARVSVSGSNGHICISGAAGQRVLVFTTDGRCVFDGKSDTGSASIAVEDGAYIVKVGSRTCKTVVSK